MPRLPGVRDVTRVSNDGLRLPALNAPAPDPTGAALEDFGESFGAFGRAFGEFRKKQKVSEDAAKLRNLDGRLAVKRIDLIANPREDQSDMTGPFEPNPVKRGEQLFDQFVDTEMEALRGTPLEGQARRIVKANRDPFRAKLRTNNFQATDETIEAEFRGAVTSFGDVVSDDPGMLPLMLEKGETALRELGEAKNWSPETLSREMGALRSELHARVLRRGIESDNAPGVLKLLAEENEFTNAIDGRVINGLRREAEGRISRDVAAFEIEAGRVFDEIERNGTSDAEIVAKAQRLLSKEKAEGVASRARTAFASHDFQEDVLFLTPEKMDEALEASFPGELASKEDHETFGSFQGVTARLMAERKADPAAYVMRDPVIAQRFEDGTNLADAIALRIQAQVDMGVPEADIQVLTKREAQDEIGKLNPLRGAARAQALLTLKERYGEHFLTALNEMLRQSASTGTRTLAEFVDNPAMVQLLGDVVGGTEAEFLKNLFPDADREEKTQILLQAADKLVPTLADLRASGRLNENVDSSTTKRLTLKIFAETGNMDEAVQRSITLLNPDGAAKTDEEDIDESVPLGKLSKVGASTRKESSDAEPPSAGGTPTASTAAEDGSDLSAPSADREKVEKLLASSLTELSSKSMADLEKEGKISRSRLERLIQVKKGIIRDIENAREEVRITKNRERINSKKLPFVIGDADIFIGSSLTSALLFAFGGNNQKISKEIEKRLPSKVKKELKLIDKSSKAIMIPLFLFSSLIDGLRRATTPKQISDSRKRLEGFEKALEEADNEVRAKKIRAEAVKILQEPAIDPE
ncbi:MAG: hypothetical protein GKS00_21955 [Alphaproteobacteria bacterium]|nr:hypothetical protein [Alphaproteobacteria bacterium]